MLAMASSDLSGFFRGKWRIHRTLAYKLGGPASATFDGSRHIPVARFLYVFLKLELFCVV